MGLPCMNIYRYETSLTASSASVSSTTLKVIGGLCRQVLVRAATDTTVFRFNLQDEDGLTIMNYGFHTGEINDFNVALPMMGQYTARITNASRDDTFDLQLSIQE